MQRSISKVLPPLILFAVAACGEAPPADVSDGAGDLPETFSFRMRNEEIRQDIINELVRQGISHWINEDGSIGFNGEDAERVDAIGFAAIGAYAARN